METTEQTLMQKYCRDALAIQDACNPVAIVQSFNEHLQKWRELGYRGWDNVITDAPFILFVSKLESLCNAQDVKVFGDAYDCCRNNVPCRPDTSIPV